MADPLKGLELEDIIKNITTFMGNLGIALVVVFIIWGALQLMTSAGNSTKQKEGQDTLKWAIIGLGVILLAQGLIYAVLETIKVKQQPNLGTSPSANTIDYAGGGSGGTW